MKCHTCRGLGQLKCYLQLTVQWNTYADDFVSDETGLSEVLIKQVTGNVAMEERAPRVYPLTSFPDVRVIDATKGLITKHANSFAMERIVEQRHNVRMVPVAMISFEHGKESGTFHVYGLEHKVFFPNYPARCCCGCVVL